LTNACSEYARAIYSCNEVISSTFDICYGVDDVPNAKPSGDGLLRICKVLGVSPADAVYIGDAPSDGQAAAAAGMTSIGVTWGSFPVKAMTPAFDVLVDTVADLEKLVMGSAALPAIECE
jgi:phosphoglycolate phosphatase-like HAD superfamily hydrolase